MKTLDDCDPVQEWGKLCFDTGEVSPVRRAYKDPDRAYAILRIAILTAIINSISACGPLVEIDNRTSAQGSVHYEVLPYVEKFESIWGRRIYGLPIHMSQFLKRQTAGTCDMAGDKSLSITISQGWWQDAEDVERELLIFHELGHCLLGRAHDNRREGGVPDSLMFWNLSEVVPYYRVNEEHYISELFGQKWIYP